MKPDHGVGPNGLVGRYESDFARHVGGQAAVAFTHARTALTCILEAEGLEPGDEIVLSPLTCKVVPLALLAMGLHLVYADVDPETLNLDVEAVRRAVGPSTRAILFQRTYGSSIGLDAIVSLAASRNLCLVEDCAQSTPSVVRPRGRAAIFSNNLRKPLPAGAGGMAVTDDSGLAARLRARRGALPRRGLAQQVGLRAEMVIHAWLLRPALYWPLYTLNQKVRGFHRNGTLEAELERDVRAVAARIGGFQARAGLRWLERLPQLVTHRRGHCRAYAEALSGHPGVTIPRRDEQEPLYYFPVLVKQKDALLRLARRRRIEVVSWPIRTPIYPIVDPADLRTYRYEPGHCPQAEQVATRLIGLPTDLATSAGHRAAVIELLERHGSPSHV